MPTTRTLLKTTALTVLALAMAAPSAAAIDRSTGDSTVATDPTSQTFELKVRVLDRNGRPYHVSDPGHADLNRVIAVDTSRGLSHAIPLDLDGRGSRSLLAGNYTVHAQIATEGVRQQPPTLTLASRTRIDVTSDAKVTLDARTGRRLHPPRVPGQSTTAVGEVMVRQHWDNGPGSPWVQHEVPVQADNILDGRVYVTPNQPTASGRYETSMRWHLEPRRRGHGAPDAYELVFTGDRFGPDLLGSRLDRGDVRDLAEISETQHPVGLVGGHAMGVSLDTPLSPGTAWDRSADVGSTRTLLVTPGDDIRWRRCLVVDVAEKRSLCEGPRSYATGSHQRVEYGGAMHASPEVVHWNEGTLYSEIGLGDGSHRMGLPPATGIARDPRITLRTREGKILGSSEAAFLMVDNLEGNRWYRLEHQWRLRPDRLNAEQRSRSTWEFRSEPASTPPVLDVDYGPRLDAYGRARAGRRLALRLGFTHTAAPDDPHVSRARLWWSSNAGSSWHSSALHRTGDTTFVTDVPARALKAGRRISLRVTAVDSLGNRLRQTSIGLVPIS